VSGAGAPSRRRRVAGALGAGLLALAAWLGPSPAGAQGPIELEVLVSQISDRPGSIDPRGEKVHRELQGRFRYQSLAVLVQRRLRLALDEVGSVALPNGKALRVRPNDVGKSGVLLAVQVEGALDTDLRVRNGHLVVVGAGRYEDGTLVISLQPSF
jgi:hypothetical protein